MDLFSAVVTLFLVMDPLGNIPVFLSVLKAVPAERRRIVLLREIAIAYVVLLGFLLLGDYLLQFLGLEQEAVLQRSVPLARGELLLALTIAWSVSAILLLSFTFLHRVLRERGLIAMERLMGMLLVMVSVQMFMNGVGTFLGR